MTSEEMDAEILRMDAVLKRPHEDAVAQFTEEMTNSRDPFEREYYRKKIERAHEIASRTS